MKYFLTEKFTIVPQAFFNESNYKHSLDLLFDIKADESIKNIHIDSLNAKLIYKEEINNYIPFIKYMVDYNSSITDYNKVIFHYCQNNRIFHLVIAKGDKLEIANTFFAGNFKSALYYLFLSLKQTITNPHQTTLRVMSNLSQQEQEIISSYFKGIEYIKLDDITLCE